MKVIHLISGGDTGGAKTHVHSLLQGLNQHIQADMVCFADGPFVQEARVLGIQVEVIPSRNPFAALKLLRGKIRQEGYDLIHCHGARGNLMGAMLRRATGLPVVTTVHSDPRLDYMGRPLSRLIFGSANAWALRSIPYHIGVSDAMVDLLIDRGFDPQRAFPIYNGISFAPVHPQLDRSSFLSSLGVCWPEDCVLVGIAARLNPVKNISTLLRGFAIAYQENPKLRLIIAGDGQEEGALHHLAQDLGIEEQVCFAGWLADTSSFYHALDINTLTSLSETFPYALTEGSRFALPTVASLVGGIPYLIDHGVNGFLFQPQDHQALGRHLAALAADPDLRHRLGARLLDKAREHYSIEVTIQRQLDLYRTILRRHCRPQNGRDGVVICGAYGQNNAGDEAVLKALLSEMRTIDPDMPLWVMTRKPKQTKLNYRTGAVYTFNIPGFCRRMARSKLYVNGGGSLIQDVTSRRSLWFYLFTLTAARRMGCRVIMYGCGIGPVSSRGSQRRAARVINRNVDTITLRDSASMDVLKDMKVNGPELVLAADPAVILPSASPEVADALLEHVGLRPGNGQKYLGITVRPWPGFEDKIPVFAAAADYAYQTYGLIPVFIPIEEHLDTVAGQQVAKAIQTAPYAILPPCACTEHAIALFSRMDIVLSMRLHALIFAAGHGVPLIGAVYDPKVSSFLEAVDQHLYAPLHQLTLPLLQQLLDQAVALGQDHPALEEKAARLIRLEQNNSISVRKLLAD